MHIVGFGVKIQMKKCKYDQNDAVGEFQLADGTHVPCCLECASNLSNIRYSNGLIKAIHTGQELYTYKGDLP